MENNIQEKAQSIQEKLKDILDDEDIELAFCIFTTKGSPDNIIAEKGHFYDITMMLSSIVRGNHKRIQGEVGV